MNFPSTNAKTVIFHSHIEHYYFLMLQTSLIMQMILDNMEELRNFQRFYENCLGQELELQKKKRKEIEEKLVLLKEDAKFDKARLKCYEESLEFFEKEVDNLEEMLKVAETERASLTKKLEETIENESSLKVSNAKLMRDLKEKELLVRILMRLDEKSKMTITALRDENQSLKEKLEKDDASITQGKESKILVTKGIQTSAEERTVNNQGYNQWFNGTRGQERDGYREYIRPQGKKWYKPRHQKKK